MDSEYRPRIVDRYFHERLKSAGALLIEGPKWCGKTSTAEKLSKSAVYLQDPDNFEMNIYYAEKKPSVLLEGAAPRLIDEWQVAPNIWNAVRFTIDKRKERGQFILTGSTVQNLDEEDEVRMHTGTGRITPVCMRTMSLFESGDSKGEISLNKLFDGENDFDSISEMTLERLAFLICRGGWPSNLTLDEKYVLRTAKDYFESIVNSDISRVDGTRRDPDTARTLLASISRNICTLSDVSTITADMNGKATRKTVTEYISALRKIFVIEDTPSWSPSLLSKTRVRKSVKRNLVDPSIAVAALNAGPQRLVSEMSSFGPLFESLCIRDLRIYSQPMEGRVYHYHDNSDLEVDAIIELDDGRWAAIEIKLNSGENQAADNLLRLRNKVKLTSGAPPSFLAILTGTGFYHVRDDGVLVIPIGCLRD